MKHMLILRGPPASGKSTFAKEVVRKNPNFIRVNLDDCRMMLHDSEYSKPNELVCKTIQENIIRQAFKNNQSVVVDNTHLNTPPVKKLYDLAMDVRDVRVTENVFGLELTLQDLLVRNSNRTDKEPVPERVVKEMFNKLQTLKYTTKPTEYPRFPQVQFEYGLPNCVICDLDGTLAIINGRSPYEQTNESVMRDYLNSSVAQAIKFAYACGIKIIFVSGRNDSCYDGTRAWINKHLDINDDDYELHMRKSQDLRKDFIVKYEILMQKIHGRFNVSFVLDDRPSVVRMWREVGLTVFQLNDKEF